MNVDQMLGIDLTDRTQRHAEALVESDENLLDELIAFRKARKLTQADVADKLGVDQSAIARIESGERDPHLSTLRRYALAVGATVDHVVCAFEADEGRGDTAIADTANTAALVVDAVLMYDMSDQMASLGLKPDREWSRPSLKAGANWYGTRAGRR